MSKALLLSKGRKPVNHAITMSIRKLKEFVRDCRRILVAWDVLVNRFVYSGNGNIRRARFKAEHFQKAL